MKILYLLPALSHPTMRGELRHYHFLRALSRRHEVSLVALTRTPATPEAIADLRASARRVLIADATPPAGDAKNDRESAGLRAWRGRYAKRQRVRQTIADMKTQVRLLLREEQFDVALVYAVELQPLLAELRGLPVVADLCDAQSIRIWQSLQFVNPIEGAWKFASWWGMRQAERAIASRAQQVTFISERDKVAVPSAAGRARIVPNGVDAGYWSRQAPSLPSNHLVFTGVMDYGPNADAAAYLATEILPRVRSALPDAKLTIAGRNPTPKLRQLADRVGGIEITGYVDDLRPSLTHASVFVAPLRFASGTQNKILEAMAMELPVVTSTVAADGLRVSGAEAPPVLVADTPGHFAARAIDLLSDPSRRRELGVRSRDYVRAHFDWERSASQLEACCLAASAVTRVEEEDGHARRVAAHE